MVILEPRPLSPRTVLALTIGAGMALFCIPFVASVLLANRILPRRTR